MSERPTLADFGFFHELVTRWSDCDMLGHINNARYFTFDESARLDYFDPMIRLNSGFWKDSGFILARIECDFIDQIHHPADRNSVVSGKSVSLSVSLGWRRSLKNKKIK